jgi:hypothetical protein
MPGVHNVSAKGRLAFNSIEHKEGLLPTATGKIGFARYDVTKAAQLSGRVENLGN